MTASNIRPRGTRMLDSSPLREWMQPVELRFAESRAARRVRRLSAARQSLVGLGVARTMNLDARRLVIELAQVVGRECDVDGAEILLEAMQLRRAGDRDDPRPLGEQPGEGDLRRRRAVCGGEPGEQLDERL